MKKDDQIKPMLKYVIPFLSYIFTPFLVSIFIDNEFLSYTLKVLFTGALLIYYYKDYKEIRWKFDFLAILLGIIIIIIWISLEGLYPSLGTSKFNPYDLSITSLIIPIIIIRFIGAVIIASFVEELFIRSFLIRLIDSKNWQKAKIGIYKLQSFIITVLLFGFSHNRWLPGIITGILLNLLLYKKKSISSCIIAHSTANLVLGIYVMYTGAWGFW